MSQDQALPDELADCEIALAALRPPPSAVDRDELMFQAGRAAALAEVSRGAGRSSATLRGAFAGGGDSQRTIAYSLASAAIAAGVAVAVTLQLRPLRDAPTAIAEHASIVGSARPSEPEVEGGSGGPSSARDRSPAIDLIDVAKWSDNAPILAARDLALRQPWNSLMFVRRAAAERDMAPAAKTRREMLEEFLPSTRSNDPPAPSTDRWRLPGLWESSQGEEKT